MEATYRPAGEKAHFYTMLGEPVFELPNKSKGGMRPVTLADARKLELLPSVTTVIRGGRPTPYGLQSWKMDLFGQYLLTTPRQESETDAEYLQRVNEEFQAAQEQAPDLGTQVHGLIACYLRGESLPEYSEAMPVFAKARSWIDEHVATVLAVEQPLAHRELGYAGTLDAVVKLTDGLVWLMDWKTQAVKDKPRSYDEWVIQLAACEHLAAGCADLDDIDAAANLIIPTTDYPAVDFAPWSVDGLVWGWKAFSLALQSYRHNARWPNGKAVAA